MFENTVRFIRQDLGGKQLTIGQIADKYHTHTSVIFAILMYGGSQSDQQVADKVSQFEKEVYKYDSEMLKQAMT